MTSPPPLRVVSLYDDVMNVYADRGNLLAVLWRAARHAVAVEVIPVSLGDALPDVADLVLIGGGQDREQRRIAEELSGQGLGSPRLGDLVGERAVHRLGQKVRVVAARIRLAGKT